MLGDWCVICDKILIFSNIEMYIIRGKIFSPLFGQRMHPLYREKFAPYVVFVIYNTYKQGNASKERQKNLIWGVQRAFCFLMF